VASTSSSSVSNTSGHVTPATQQRAPSSSSCFVQVDREIRVGAQRSVTRADIQAAEPHFVFIAAAYYLNTLGYELWVSFLFVVGGLTLGGVILGLFAMRQASKITFGTKTAKSVRNTVQTISSIRPGSK
jgi:hypothetical protein